MTGIDFAILNFIQAHLRCAFLDSVMPAITALGNAGVVWIALTALMLLVPKYRKIGFTMAAALLMDLALCNGIIKPLAARIRPFDINTAVQLIIAKPTD